MRVWYLRVRPSTNGMVRVNPWAGFVTPIRDEGDRTGTHPRNISGGDG